MFDLTPTSEASSLSVRRQHGNMSRRRNCFQRRSIDSEWKTQGGCPVDQREQCCVLPQQFTTGHCMHKI